MTRKRNREKNFLGLAIRRKLFDKWGIVLPMEAVHDVMKLIDNYQPIDSIKVGGTD